MSDRGYVFQINNDEALRGFIAPSYAKAKKLAQKSFPGAKLKLVDETDDPPQCPQCVAGKQHQH